jgi:hypothetical protein
VKPKIEWNEGSIARVLARNTFDGMLCVLPNTTWTGCEIDLLVVGPGLRMIDVEIKITRADLRADKHKDKWWHYPNWDRRIHLERPARQPRAWPLRTWKHYYAMPAQLWNDEMHAEVQAISGVLLVHDSNRAGGKLGRVECVKRAKPCRDAPVLSHSQVINLARLASVRMWDAYFKLERCGDAGAADTGT